jgi:arylsulfatase A-like enzyme
MNIFRVLGLILILSGAPAGGAESPNVILIVADDMGYADMSSQGARFKTPNLDRMAAEGTRFTSFYVAQAVCTASRAALLTGCYPNRVGLQGALNHTSPNGLHPEVRMEFTRMSG